MKIENKIKMIIKHSKNIFIIAHKNLDLDALGACVGVSSICSHFNKKSYIIIDDINHELGVKKILSDIKNKVKIIKSSEILTYHHKRSILVIVDTNKAHLLQNDQVLNYFDKIIILDHHQETEQTISNTTNIINDNASST